VFIFGSAFILFILACNIFTPFYFLSINRCADRTKGATKRRYYNAQWRGFARCGQHGIFVILQHTATHCNTLQHIIAHCNTLQNAWHSDEASCTVIKKALVWWCNALQHTVTHCNTLQHTALHCNTLQHAATHCNTLQHTASHCNTMQRILYMFI